MAEQADNVLRGGSWNNNRDTAGCAFRNDNNPDNDNDNNGFRLATRAHRPPELRCAVIHRNVEAQEENDRPVPGSPWASQTPPAPLSVVGGHPPTPGAAHDCYELAATSRRHDLTRGGPLANILAIDRRRH